MSLTSGSDAPCRTKLVAKLWRRTWDPTYRQGGATPVRVNASFRGHSVGCYLNNATAERTEKVAGHAATRVWPRLRGRRLSAVAAARCPPPLPHSTIIGWRGWLPRGWLSTEERRPLPESREEIRSHLEITGQIDHNTIPINRLETQAGMRAAGSRGMLLREAAGRNST